MGDGAAGRQLVRVYDLAGDDQVVRQMQHASLHRPDAGLSPEPLVGGQEWWDEVASGRRPTRRLEGRIVGVLWGSMADWPEFRLREAGGAESVRTREGDVRRYAAGLFVRLDFVEHAWKPGVAVRGLGEASQIVLRVEIEDSQLRSSAIAPGPGGAGYREARRRGDAVHYLGFPTHAGARRAERALAEVGMVLSPRGGAAPRAWWVEAWHGDASTVGRRWSELRALAARNGGWYDGGEIVEGAVWGPGGPP